MKDGTYSNFPVVMMPSVSNEINRMIELVRSTPVIPQQIVLAPPSAVSEIARSIIAENARMAIRPLLPFEVMSSPYCIRREQTRFPRSKKKRIQKKWSKDERNWGDIPKIFLIDKNDFYKNPFEDMKAWHDL